MKPATADQDGDYGVIPGTKKPTLLQPGADKLNNLFGLIPTFEVIEKELDWTGATHGGEPFFFYEVKCRLFRADWCMGEGTGSANSWESKYRWRKSERLCPSCGKPAVLKSKDKDEWFCWKKKDGCGRTFRGDDPQITEQKVGNVPNPDIADQVNTVLKMANKRAKIAATLNATSAHEFFTQDLEDIPRTPEAQEDRKAEPRQQAPQHEPERAPEQQQQHQTKRKTDPKQAQLERVRILNELRSDFDKLGCQHQFETIWNEYPWRVPSEVPKGAQSREMVQRLRDKLAELRAKLEVTDADAITDDKDTRVPPANSKTPAQAQGALIDVPEPLNYAD
jgi:hypothetical protein